MKTLNIYFSDVCNLNCSYCCLQQEQHKNNSNICKALEDGSFVNYVKHNLTKETIALGFWGMEPTINGKYFQRFITEILNYSPYIKYIYLTTNCISSSIYSNFIAPLIKYTQNNQRKLIFWMQVSLDGPQSIMDKHRGAGVYNQVINNLMNICSLYPNKSLSYLRFRITIKPTFEPNDWDTNPEDWYEWRDAFVKQLELINNNIDYSLLKKVTPMITHGVSYTKANGLAFARWYHNLEPTKNKCAAGLTSKTIDYTGQLYDCPILKNRAGHIATQEEQELINKARTQNNNQQICITNPNIDINALVEQQEIMEQDFNKLINVVCSNLCFATDYQSDQIISYLKLFGNGAML